MKNKLLFFICFLIFFCYFLVNFQFTKGLYPTGDEETYLENSKILMKKGLFSDIKLNIWYGPGFSFLITLITELGISQIENIRCFNFVLIILSMLINYLSYFNLTKSSQLSLMFSVLILPWALDSIDFFRVHTESFVYLIISIIVYLKLIYFETNKKFILKLIWFFLGVLSITKVVFIYVLIISFFIYVLVNIKFNYSLKFLRYSWITISIIFIWFFYTYSLTGKLFYPGSSGGLQLYCMTTNDSRKDGVWKGVHEIISMGGKDSIDLKSILANSVETWDFDSRIKIVAIENFVAAPHLYFRRVFNNCYRFFFPNYSNDSILSLILYLKNIILLMFFLFSLVIVFVFPGLNKERINYIIIFLGIYFVISVLLSTYYRFFIIMWPIVVYFILNVLMQLKLVLKISKRT
jgi:hypothetical protein